MEKLKLHTTDMAERNVELLGQMFPNCLTETINADGKLVRAIDFDKLRQELACEVVEGAEERYQFTWPDKRAAIRLANAPINKTLRPCREESVDFDNTKNIYIEGDNLEVLKFLRESYLGKIDVIYIDPPYNTGRNLIYKNDFAADIDSYLQNSGQFDELGNRLVLNTESNGRFHTDWLNMIYTRLKVAKDLLSNNGIIVLTIDDCEIETITMVMNEIFGECNHLATFIIKNNPSGRSTVTGASISHEYALCYGANTSVSLGRLPRNDKQIARYKESDEIGAYEWVNFRKHGGYKEDAPTMYYPIYIKKDCSSFRIPKMKWNNSTDEYDVLESIFEDEFVSYPIDEAGRPRRWKWSLERALKEQKDMCVRLDRDKIPAVYIKSRMKDEGMLPLTVWDDRLYSSTEYGTNFLTDLMGARYFDYPKSIYAVIDSLRIANCHRDSTVLDFFSGSATTAHAVMQLNAEDGGNRKFIMVQLPEKTDEESEAYKAGYKNICEIGKERIRRAGRKIKEDNASKEGIERLDVGFRVLKLDESNMADVYYTPADTPIQTTLAFDALVDNIREGRTAEDLLFQVLPECNLPLSSKIEIREIHGKKVFVVEDGYLMACFDKDINEAVITAIAKEKPYYFVMCDRSIATDNVADNFDQIFNAYSKETVRRIL
jgi:adenine-specific DNA-methyltransferase